MRFYNVALMRYHSSSVVTTIATAVSTGAHDLIELPKIATEFLVSTLNKRLDQSLFLTVRAPESGRSPALCITNRICRIVSSL